MSPEAVIQWAGMFIIAAAITACWKSMAKLAKTADDNAHSLLRVNATGSEMVKSLDRMARKLEDLHNWHNVDNPAHPGSKAWYTTDVELLITQLRGDFGEIKDLLKELIKQLREAN